MILVDTRSSHRRRTTSGPCWTIEKRKSDIVRSKFALNKLKTFTSSLQDDSTKNGHNMLSSKRRSYLPCFCSCFDVKWFPADTNSFVRVSLEKVSAVRFYRVRLRIVGTFERTLFAGFTVEIEFTWKHWKKNTTKFFTPFCVKYEECSKLRNWTERHDIYRACIAIEKAPKTSSCRNRKRCARTMSWWWASLCLSPAFILKEQQKHTSLMRNISRSWQKRRRKPRTHWQGHRRIVHVWIVPLICYILQTMADLCPQRISGRGQGESNRGPSHGRSTNTRILRENRKNWPRLQVWQPSALRFKLPASLQRLSTKVLVIIFCPA